MKLGQHLVLAFLLLISSIAMGVQVSPKDFGKEKPQGPYEVIAPRTAQPPEIDGDLSDPAWEKAAVVKSFWQAGSVDPAEDQTIVRVCFDEKNLYVGWACLDKKLKGGPVARDDKAIWGHDGIELFLSPERSPGTERQFILSVFNSRFDRHPDKKYGKYGSDWDPDPDWTGKVKRQPWGYTAEMRVPFAGLIDTKKFPVARGGVWTMKLTREDYGDHRGVRTTSWTPIGRSTHDPHSIGKLIFEDRNIIENGDVETPGKDGAPKGWSGSAKKHTFRVTRVTGDKTEGRAAGQIHLDGVDGGHFSIQTGVPHIRRQPVDTTYVFSADIKSEAEKGNNFVGYFRVGVGKNLQVGKFKHNAGWQKVRLPITILAGQGFGMLNFHGVSRGKAVVTIDNARLEIVDLVALDMDPDEVCLTGNATGAVRTRNRRVAGTYTYTESMTTDPCFPHYFPKGYGPPQDYGLYRGEVPFDKGRLTDGNTPTTVTWALYWSAFTGRDITFDLKKEVEVTRVVVKVSWPGLGITRVFVKSPGETVYALTAASTDVVAFRQKKTAPRTDVREFKRINQPARWVRIQTEARSPANFAEIEIWGRDLKPGKRPKRKPYLQASGVVAVKDPNGKPESLRDVPPLFPMPKEMKLSGRALRLADGMTIAYEPAKSDRARTTAEVLRDEMNACYGLSMKVAPCAGEPGEGSILVGEAADSPVTARTLRQSKARLTKTSPGRDGYVLIADGKRVVIGGSDPRGAFYGTQALLTLTRKAAAGGWEVPGIAIRDWPDMKYRIIEGRPIPTKDLVRGLARFRITHYTPSGRWLAQAAAVDGFGKRYFVKFIPCLDPNRIVLGKDRTLTERPPSERWQDVPTGRANANPAHPRTWEIYFAEVDKWLPKFHGDFVYINLDETYQQGHGSRWNVSKESRALNMTAWQLLAHFINRIDKKFKQHNKRIMMMDTPFMRKETLSYPGDPDPNWLKALPHIPKDILFNVWHPSLVEKRLGKEYGFEMVRLVLDDMDWRGRDFSAYAGLNNYMAESAFTPNKLLDTAWVAWNLKAVRPHDPAADAAVTRNIPLWSSLHLGAPLPRTFFAGKTDYTPLDISAVANRSRIDEVAYDGKGWVDMGPNVDLRALKPGVQDMAGVPFRIIDEAKNRGKSVVMVHNRAFVDRTLPDATEIKLDGVKASGLAFLHCLDNAPGWNYLRRKELSGFYFIVFEDGTYAKIDLKYATNIGNWSGLPTPAGYNPRGHTMAKGRLAWRGQTLSGFEACLYMTEWVNPRPDLKIEKIVLRATYDPTKMNPMLLGVTALDPRLAEKPSPVKLPSAEKLLPPKPVGVLHDLAGGKDESETRYVAPDGTVIETTRINNHLSDLLGYAHAQGYRSYVGLVTYEGAQAARTGELVFTFPKDLPVTGALVTGHFREQRKVQDFSSMVFDVFLDVSEDNGKTWKPESVVRATSPEEHGPVWLPVKRDAVRTIRLRLKPHPGTHYVGFTSVKLHRRD